MKKINNFIEKMFGFFDLKKIDFKFSEEERKFLVDIKADDEKIGYLIGYKGETLFSLQKIFNFVFFEELKGKKVFININDYLKNREEKIKQMALLAANKVIETQKSYCFEHLNSYDRFVIHQTISQNEEYKNKVKTHSEGEGSERVLILCFK